MESFRTQLKQVLRRLRHSPMFTAITLVTLGIGIGANSAIFSVVNAVLLKPLPYPHPDSLVSVWQTAPGLGFRELNASPATYFTYREEGRAFQDIGLWASQSASVTGVAEPEQVETLVVTHGTLPVLGVQPLRGRWFMPEDDSPSRPETTILTYGYWQRRFGGDSSALGRRIMIDGRAREVIGIMPADFRFLNRRPALILPFQFDRNKVFVGNFSFQAIARLKPGLTIDQGNADVARMLPLLPQKFPLAPGLTLKILEEARIGPSVRPLKQDVIGDIGNVLWVLMSTVGIVLFIACANVANLLLVRAEGRQQELAIRAALGASRSRVAGELLLESLTLALVGGVVGVGVAYAALRLLVVLAPVNLPRLDEVSIDPRVLLFTIGISLVAGLLFGLVPVVRYAGPRIQGTLRAGGRTFSDGRERNRMRSTLVVVQVALALVLLVGSGLMIRTFQALRHVQPGFTQPEQILTLRISIPNAQVPEPERAARMYNDILDRIAAIPGVESVGLSNSITMDGSKSADPIFAEDRPTSEGQLPPIRRYKYLSPGYFRAMGNPVVAGRDFTWTDIHATRPVTLVSENLAREYWGTPSAALGKRIRENPKGTWREIVGVVRNERDNGIDQEAPTIVYWPLLIKNFWSAPIEVRRTLAFAIRSKRTGSDNFMKDISRAVWAVNSELPFANVRTVKEIYDRSMARSSFTLVMLALAAGMALLLGVVGIYGVISYTISQRVREVGIRMALGATQQRVRFLFVRHGVLLAVTGVVCGVAAAIPLTRLMSALLFEVSPLDPLTYCAVSVALVAAALLASYVPASRATRIEPIEALRAE
jgi:putative ABC transport system permease protein